MHLSLSFPAFVLALASLTPFTSAQVYTVSLVAYDRTFFQGRSVTYNRGGNFRLGFNANRYISLFPRSSISHYTCPRTTEPLYNDSPPPTTNPQPLPSSPSNSAKAPTRTAASLSVSTPAK
ncbi:hypothetical protein H2201_004192 [Coniosporium apollinis]|uniref:Uncharacterized protein n=1 Tax=Coniosporium apollinis TaxID=61459 RepID=A0ABQ9NYN6_9PEZI|nr:hypothetical protein H2201_004192 [Coniosporium apollinis]